MVFNRIIPIFALDVYPQLKSTIMKNLKTTLLFCLISTLAFCNISEKEKNALLAICHATQGDHWTVTWNMEAPISSWHGIVVEDDKVVELDLSFNNLQGQLPDELGDLVNLKTLNLFLSYL